MTSTIRKARWSVSVDAEIRRRGKYSGDARKVAEMFGLADGHCQTLYDGFRLDISPGQIIAVVGPSGAGKSVLLRALRRQIRGSVELRTDRLSCCSDASVEVLKGGTLGERLEVLSRCGLAEATALVTTARRLSGGQLYRLALAKALFDARRRRGGCVVIADEFAATLDGETAAVLCRQVRKLVSGSNIALVVATPRDELAGALQPDVTIVKPLGQPARVMAAGRRGRLVEPDRWQIVRGTIEDYKALAGFHYVAGPPATHKRVYVIRRPAKVVAVGGSAVAAVLVVSPPLMHCRGRNVALGGRYTLPDRREAMGYLNDEIEAISRVVVHPTYRSCGLAVRLVRHALKDAHRPMVEALAAMGAVHPLFAIAGMPVCGQFEGPRGCYSYYLIKLLRWVSG